MLSIFFGDGVALSQKNTKSSLFVDSSASYTLPPSFAIEWLLLADVSVTISDMPETILVEPELIWITL